MDVDGPNDQELLRPSAGVYQGGQGPLSGAEDDEVETDENGSEEELAEGPLQRAEEENDRSEEEDLDPLDDPDLLARLAELYGDESLGDEQRECESTVSMV